MAQVVRAKRPLAAGALSDMQLVCQVIYTEYGLVPAEQRRRSRWVMDPGMLEFVLEALYNPDGSYLSFKAAARQFRDRLLNLPVELRSGVEGIHLEPIKEAAA